jgi:hypothetical protein
MLMEWLLMKLNPRRTCWLLFSLGLRNGQQLLGALRLGPTEERFHKSERGSNEALPPFRI